MNSAVRSGLSYLLVGIGFHATLAQDAPPLYISPGTDVSANKLLLSLDGLSLNDQGDFWQDSSTLRFYAPEEDLVQYVISDASFYKFELALEGRSLSLESDLILSNELFMESGILNLNANTLHLAGEYARITGENEHNRIMGVGTIETLINLSFPNRARPGNLGMEISAEAKLGMSTLRRIHKPSQADSLFLIERHYELIPTLQVEVPISVSLDYYSAENPFGPGQSLIPLQEKNHQYGKLAYFTDRPFQNKMDIILPPGQKDWQLALTHEEKLTPRSPQQVDVGPNPFYNQVEISWAKREDRATGVQLYASGGALVYEQAISDYGASFHLENLGDLAAGIYVLKIETDTGMLLSQTLLKAARE